MFGVTHLVVVFLITNIPKVTVTYNVFLEHTGMELDVFNIQHMMDVEDMVDVTTIIMTTLQSLSSLSTTQTRTTIIKKTIIVLMD